MLTKALQLIDPWGFTFKTVGWAKTNKAADRQGLIRGFEDGSETQRGWWDWLGFGGLNLRGSLRCCRVNALAKLLVLLFEIIVALFQSIEALHDDF